MGNQLFALSESGEVDHPPAAEHGVGATQADDDDISMSGDVSVDQLFHPFAGVPTQSEEHMTQHDPSPVLQGPGHAINIGSGNQNKFSSKMVRFTPKADYAGGSQN